MKLGFLLFDYFPFGGLQRDCLKIAKLCATRGHDVTIFTRTWQGAQPEDLKVKLFGRSGWSNVQGNRAWLRQLAAELPQQKLDGLIGFNKLPGLDVYYGSDPCYAAKTDRLKPGWYKWLPRYRHFSALERAVFVHGGIAQALMLTEREIPNYQRYYKTERERFHLLPPGIERREFNREARDTARANIRQQNGWAPGDLLLVLIGSGFRVKGLDRAIRSVAALPESLRAATRLVVIGQNRPGEFQMLARRLGIPNRVHFLGGRNDVFKFQLAADLLVHPALSEAAGMVLLESLTAGLPVLCTDVCGYAFHIERANAGRILPSPFSQEICDRAVAEMLQSDKRTAWQANAVAYAAREDLYSCHDTAVNMIERIIRQKHR